MIFTELQTRLGLVLDIDRRYTPETAVEIEFYYEGFILDYYRITTGFGRN
ncbi:hypothetical protein ACQ4M3_01025 [Leptolyngbya sp. AN03gr2]